MAQWGDSEAAPSELDPESVAFLADACRISREQVCQLYSEFKAAQPTGSMGDFLNLMDKTHSSAVLLREKAHQLFMIFEGDVDSCIYKEDVHAIIHAVFETARDRGVQLSKTPHQVCEEFFRQLDTDKNCEISHDEFVDGVLSDPDLLRILQTPEVMDTLGR